jgi:hypothetical protein
VKTDANWAPGFFYFRAKRICSKWINDNCVLKELKLKPTTLDIWFTEGQKYDLLKCDLGEGGAIIWHREVWTGSETHLEYFKIFQHLQEVNLILFIRLAMKYNIVLEYEEIFCQGIELRWKNLKFKYFSNFMINKYKSQ